MKVMLALHPECKVEWLGVSRLGRRTALSDQLLLTTLSEGVELNKIEQLSTTLAGFTVSEVLNTLHSRRLLQWRLISDDGIQIAAAAPQRTGEPWPNFNSGHVGGISRFASVHNQSGVWVLASGASNWEVVLESSGLVQLANDDRNLLAFLAPLGLLDEADSSPALAMWEPLDLMFATRIAMDFDPEHIGGTFRFRELSGPTGYEQAKDFTGEILSLPDPPPLPAVDFGALVDQRRSIRDFTDEPVPIEVLSSLLWHTLRVTRFLPLDPEIEDSYDSVVKSVASAGAAAAIDAWVVARDVCGVESGTWWYNPLTHQLHRTSHSTLTFDAEQAPQISIILATRHERLAWKYERLAFSLALRDAGVLIHALQLTATALGLASVPQGGSANRELIEAMATDQYRRMPIGQVWVGNPAMK